MPQRERYPERSRWVDLLGVLANQANARGRESFSFEVVSKPADGARALWSDGHQNYGGHTVVVKKLAHLVACLFHPRRIGRAHKGIVPVRQ